MDDAEKKTILLVEDEPLIAMAEKKTLERHGYAVIHVSTGEKAVTFVRDNGAVDLVLMDINLGSGISGTEAAEEILRGRDVPVVFLSSHTDPEIVRQTEGITSYGYIVKHSGETVLLASIRMAFRLFMEKRAVRDRSNLLQGILDSTQDGIHVLDPDLTIRQVNETMERWHPEDRSFIGRKCYSVYHRRETPCVVCPSLRALQSGAVERDEVPARSDSPVEWLEVFSYPLRDPDSGRITGIVEFVRDITTRRKMERELRTGADQLRGILSGMNDAIWSLSWPDLKLLFCSPSAEKLYGIGAEAFSLDRVAEITHPDDRGRITEAMEALRQKGSVDQEFRIVRPDGEIAWIHDRATLERDAQDRPIRVNGIATDITERKKLEERRSRLAQAAREFNEYTFESIDYGRILETARILAGASYAVFNTIDASGRNCVTVALAGRAGSNGQELPIPGFPLSSAAGGNALNQSDPATGCRISSFASLRDYAGEETEAIPPHVVPEPYRGSPVSVVRTSKEGFPLGDFLFFFEPGQTLANQPAVEIYAEMVGLVLSRTETEKRNADLVREKEILLKEVQHRVKNTMNTMVSMLHLQSATLKQPGAIAALRDAGSRFRSMEVLFDQLYRAETYDQGSTGAYLPDLVRKVVDLFPNGRDLRITTDVEDFLLSTRQLSTLGMIVNELVTNAMKYAFISEREPHLSVRVARREGTVTVVVEDNGPGLPETFDSAESTGFGMTMVRALTTQLRGTIHFNSSRGTRITLVFAV